jgi:hypothetical protein
MCGSIFGRFGLRPLGPLHEVERRNRFYHLLRSANEMVSSLAFRSTRTTASDSCSRHHAQLPLVLRAVKCYNCGSKSPHPPPPNHRRRPSQGV